MKKRMIASLISRGFFESDAEHIVDSCVKHLAEQEIIINWDRGEYPDAVVKMIQQYVDNKALDWIKENKPKAWYRTLFETTEMKGSNHERQEKE